MLKLNNVMNAFVLAHRASENDKYDLATREVFRAIAHELWMAAGRPDDQELLNEEQIPASDPDREIA